MERPGDALVHNAVSVRSKENYSKCLHRFGTWLSNSDDPALQRLAVETNARNREGQVYLSVDAHGLVEHNLDPFYAFITDLQVEYQRAADGTVVVDERGEKIVVKTRAPATLFAFRTAVTHLLKQADITLTERQLNYRKSFFAGMHRKAATLKESGHGNPEVGKAELPRVLHERLAEDTLADESNSRSVRWSHCFMLFLWNLVCRSVNAATIHFSHLTASEDFIVVVFSKTKSDQVGARSMRHHIFANPLKPAVCPVLGLALYLLEGLAASSDGSFNFLFPGARQEKRFSKCLSKLWAKPVTAAFMKSLSVTKERLGTHSWRKGAASAAALGSPDGPGILAVCLRAGWKIGTVLERYLKKQASSDCFMGRILCGLPQNTQDFAQLPPHFDPTDQFVQEAISHIFPPGIAAMENMTSVLRLCLGSLVFHAQYLSDTCPHHPALSTPLFSTAGLLAQLRARLVSGRSSPHMQATGIPVWVNIQDSIGSLDTGVEAVRHELGECTSEFRNATSSLHEAFEGMKRDVRGDLQKLQETIDTAVSTGVQTALSSANMEMCNITPEALGVAVKAAMAEAGLTDFSHDGAMPCQGTSRFEEIGRLLAEIKRHIQTAQEHGNRLSATAASNSNATDNAAAAPGTAAAMPGTAAANHVPYAGFVGRDELGRAIYKYDNHTGFHILPREFELPSSLLQAGWLLWFVGNVSQGIPPLRQVPSFDLAHSLKLQKGYSEWKKLFGGAETYLAKNGIDVDQADQASLANELFAKALPFLVYDQPRKRTRPVTVATLATGMKVRKIDERCLSVMAQEAVRAAAAATDVVASSAE